ncbi:MAG: metal-dependent transcriptional regulator [Flavobacteriales bacterium]|nr:metal-dependent transcriptional regulator [Flavobacteriales bacterium]
MNTQTEENYLKAIYKLFVQDDTAVSTNSIAERLHTKASSVTDMLKKLAEKKLINYAKYQGVSLTEAGEQVALKIIRKHRLWEVFLVDQLKFKWDEVHDIAEQLEHVVSPEMVNRLDKFLDFPKFDPHGDPIPDKNGLFTNRKEFSLADLRKKDQGVIVGVNDSSVAFLQYLEEKNLVLGTEVRLVERFKYDNSMAIELDGKKEITISSKVARNINISQI